MMPMADLRHASMSAAERLTAHHATKRPTHPLYARLYDEVAAITPEHHDHGDAASEDHPRDALVRRAAHRLRPGAGSASPSCPWSPSWRRALSPWPAPPSS